MCDKKLILCVKKEYIVFHVSSILFYTEVQAKFWAAWQSLWRQNVGPSSWIEPTAKPYIPSNQGVHVGVPRVVPRGVPGCVLESDYQERSRCCSQRRDVGSAEAFPLVFTGEFQRCVLEPDYQKCSKGSSKGVFWSRITRNVPGGVPRGVSNALLIVFNFQGRTRCTNNPELTKLLCEN